ncbi:DUF418 domain-containing protein [Thalassotalea profundi]|uniref:DUF418 domain-containing protein n=1 Tax=Thalassotalea profundi TaxID=2036687 RepID=A0ABQ3IMK5_9GAMM|nr:DUF418 domain-containing protein [Thalassotalea profundi]GHE88817.1 hypothetical protein GCM10011501_17810 [Thalassotalea profundi]
MENAQGGSELTNALTKLAPIDESKRIDALDILRGIALIGILLMNIEWFNRPMVNLIGFDNSLSGTDHAVGWLIRCFVEGKFYKLFALLFGMGFAVMLIRAKEVGRPFGAWFTRRMLALWILGIAHMVFLWGGDILHDYALAGLILLAWVYLLQKPRFQQYDNTHSYLKLSLIWLFLPIFFSTIAGIGAGIFIDHEKTLANWSEEQEISAIVAQRLEISAEPLELIKTDKLHKDSSQLENEEVANQSTGEADESEDPKEESIKELVTAERDIQEKELAETKAFTEGSYWKATEYRLEFLAFMLPFSPLFAFMMLIPIFILGFWFVASKRIINYQQYIPMYKMMMRIGLSLGIFLNAAGLLLLQQPAAQISTVIASVGEMIFFVGQYVLTAGYLGLVICLLNNTKWHARLAKFAPMGKMALTNYLMHSIILTSIFYGYAGGQYGEISRGPQVLIVLAIIIFQILLSTWWLNHYRFGPMEWLWRSITYKKFQPMHI